MTKVTKCHECRGPLFSPERATLVDQGPGLVVLVTIVLDLELYRDGDSVGRLATPLASLKVRVIVDERRIPV
jgi:hypothetical protein